MSRKTYEELVWQLSRLPGGAHAAVPDFFGRLLDGAPDSGAEEEAWHLHGGARLSLRGDRLSAHLGEETTQLATLPGELLDAAQEAGLSPLLLGLLALATGDLDGDRRLKSVLPQVDGAAKDLMLMTVCRLCG